MSTIKNRFAEAEPIVLQGRIELRPIAELKPYAANARKHAKSQITKLAAAIHEFGFVAPVLVGAHGNVLAGHARLEAANRLRMDSVPTLRVEHLTEAQQRAFIIADNRLAELARWDDALLKQELQALLELDFPVEVVGYETPDLDKLLRVIDEDDEAPEVDEDTPVVARLGDLFLLGRHRVYCGDSTLQTSYEAVLGDERARLVFTDPPYNVPIRGHVSSNRKHGEFAMASGEMSLGRNEKRAVRPVFSYFLAERVSPEFELRRTSQHFISCASPLCRLQPFTSHRFLTYHQIARGLMGVTMGSMRKGCRHGSEG
ncbi:MAG TPA: ParB/Srx family N-terminal domain-containing protein [Burkholderiaceae bacterium]